MTSIPPFEAIAEQLRTARAKWYARGNGVRPPGVAEIAPGPGRESVWDYPRPPRVEDVPEEIVVVFAGIEIARTTRGRRVLETAGAPCYYLPPSAFVPGTIVATERVSLCEWKGVATLCDVVAGGRVARRAAWRYDDPYTDLGMHYESIAGWPSVYPGRMDVVTLGGEAVRPQPGNYYGGWVTNRVVGPVKGMPGTESW